MSLKVTILGSGSSGGVPRVGSGWGACDPSDPRNRRRRCSILVEQASVGGLTRVLVDTSPDLREQLLDADVARLDAVLFTHQHADHTHGIDDLRPLAIAMHRKIPVYADPETLDLLVARFGYCFVTPPGSGYPPILESRLLDTSDPVMIPGEGGILEAQPFVMEHGDIDALGFRFGGIAYAPDVSRMPEPAIGMLQDLDVLILDALRYTPHPTHFSVDEALDLIETVRPRRAVLTNLHTDLDYDELSARLPSHVVPAYDGLQIQSGSSTA